MFSGNAAGRFSALLLFLSALLLADAVTLRSSSLRKKVSAGVDEGHKQSPCISHPLPEGWDLDFKVVKSSPIVQQERVKCLCAADEFWHWESKKCFKNGGRGYECGFFSKRMQPFVCQSGLTCQRVHTSVDYLENPGAVPASCQPCPTSSAKPQKGRGCYKEYLLSGQACATVRATLVKNTAAPAAVTEKYTAKESASANKKSGRVTAKVDGHEGTGKGWSGTVVRHASATASATKSVQRGDPVSVVANSCVTIPEVKNKLGLEEGLHIGVKWAAKVAFEADLMANNAAMRNAAALAKHEATMAKGAEMAYIKIARKEAKEEARRKAEAQAQAVAAAKAEAAATKLARKVAENAARRSAKAAKAKKATTTKAEAAEIDRKLAEEGAAERKAAGAEEAEERRKDTEAADAAAKEAR